MKEVIQQTETVAKPVYSAFTRACYPLMNLCKRYHSQRVSRAELMEFAAWVEGLGQLKFRDEVALFLSELGYKLEASSANHTDINAVRNNEKIYIRVIQDSESVLLEEDGPDEIFVADFGRTVADSAATVGILVSVGRITLSARAFTLRHNLFSLCLYDLYKCIYANREKYDEKMIEQLCA